MPGETWRGACDEVRTPRNKIRGAQAPTQPDRRFMHRVNGGTKRGCALLVDRIVWIAAADARGHLMRAQLMRRLMAELEIEVDIFTTSQKGREFLARFDTPSTLLSERYRVEFEGAQNLDRAATERRIIEYFFARDGYSADLRLIDLAAQGATLVVNDFHPALLWRRAERWPLVHLYGHNLRHAIESHFAEHGPRLFDRGLRNYVRRRLSRSIARIEHGIGAGSSDPGAIVLPPLLAPPLESPEIVRGKLGAKGRPLAAIYLNPHFCDPSLAETLEHALRGSVIYAVGEGYADRPGWRAVDDQFTSVAASADVLISAPGLGALGLATLLKRPFLALLTDQPEQRRNYQLARGELNCSAVDLSAGDRDFAAALKRLAPAPPCPAGAIEEARATWATTFLALAGTRKERAA